MLFGGMWGYWYVVVSSWGVRLEEGFERLERRRVAEERTHVEEA